MRLNFFNIKYFFIWEKIITFALENISYTLYNINDGNIQHNKNY